MDDTETTPSPTSALAQWNMLVGELLAAGVSTMNAHELVHSQHPGLWLQATAEHARECCHRGLTRPLA